MANPRSPQDVPHGARPTSRRSVTREPKQVADPVQGIEIRIPASAQWVRVVRLAVAGVASRMRFFYQDIEDIKLAVAEACNNAILHAETPERSDATVLPVVVVQLVPHADHLEIVVADEGPLPVAGLPAPARPEEARSGGSPDELPESGLGLLLIRILMDTVEYRAGPTSNTTIRMVKYVRPYSEYSGEQHDS